MQELGELWGQFPIRELSEPLGFEGDALDRNVIVWCVLNISSAMDSLPHESRNLLLVVTLNYFILSVLRYLLICYQILKGSVFWPQCTIMSLQSKLHSYLKTDLSQLEIDYESRTQSNSTSPPTPPSSPTSSVTVLQDRSNFDQRSNFRVYEAKRILQSCNVRNIELLCQFRPYEDESLPARILQCHREPRLDVILKCLDIQANNWDRDKKVDVILERLVPKTTHSSFKWMWPAFRQMDEMDPRRVADIFDERWLFHFRRVPFEDWVRQALDCSPTSVAEFLDQMRAIRDQLAKHLWHVPEAFEKYAQVERVCHHHVPLDVILG